MRFFPFDVMTEDALAGDYLMPVVFLRGDRISQRPCIDVAIV